MNKKKNETYFSGSRRLIFLEVANRTDKFIIIIIITSNLFTRSKSQPYRRIRGAVKFIWKAINAIWQSGEMEYLTEMKLFAEK